MAVSDITADAVNKVLDEFDQIGREQFLQHYDIGPARGWYVLRNGRKYDAKAVLGAAHGKLAGRRPLMAEEFHGGAASVGPLRKLGFEVQTPADTITQTIPFVPGKSYHRQHDIHQAFGGQERGGISTPDGVPFIFLFTGEGGNQYGYQDGWKDDDTFEYTGEGQRGPMEFVRGNRAIRDHSLEGKDLLLFEAERTKGRYRYIGCFSCGSYNIRPGKDVDGARRDVIVFQLVPVEQVETDQTDTELLERNESSLEELRQAALRAAQENPSEGKDAIRKYYQRSQTIRAYILARANGKCELCGKPAPFLRKNGTPYLEPHHTLRLADGGPDHPQFVGAICPACHREIHHGEHGASLNESLKRHLSQIEPP
jgi:5-methylcytosine-specific restriction protein A